MILQLHPCSINYSLLEAFTIIQIKGSRKGTSCDNTAHYYLLSIVSIYCKSIYCDLTVWYIFGLSLHKNGVFTAF